MRRSGRPFCRPGARTVPRRTVEWVPALAGCGADELTQNQLKRPCYDQTKQTVCPSRATTLPRQPQLITAGPCKEPLINGCRVLESEPDKPLWMPEGAA